MMKKRFLIKFLILVSLLLNACGKNSGGLENLNPDPDGDPWIAGGGKILTEEEKQKIPSVKSVFTIEANENLPSMVDNSTNKYFRPIFRQYGGSCAQASGVGYHFTYEINRIRDLDSSIEENQYAPYYTYNFVNSGQDRGSTATGGWNVIRDNGCMTYAEYGGQYNDSLSGDDVFSYWVNGYDKYYQAMNDRAMGYYRIDVNTPEGIQLLKRYMLNHLDGSQVGGVVNFSCNITNSTYETLPSDSAESGKQIVTEWGDSGPHAMVFAGYNDDVKFDFNGDGKYTNDLDINGDGIVNISDWEKGALLVVNSWGTSWKNNGKVYMMYRLLNNLNSVYLVRAKSSYTPQATLKVKLKHSNRESITISAGIAVDPDAESPEYIKTYSAFKKRGGELPISGIDDEPIEIGLDISDLLVHANNNQEVKIFLKVDERETFSAFDDNGEGEIISLSLLDYTTGTPVESISTDSNVSIVDSGETLLSINKSFSLTPPKNLTAYVNQEGNISLQWSDDSTGVSSYNVYRNGIYVGNSSAKSYVDNTIVKGEEYRYYVSQIVNGREFGSSMTAKITNNETSLPKTLPYLEDFELNTMTNISDNTSGSILPYGWETTNSSWFTSKISMVYSSILSPNGSVEGERSIITPPIDLSTGEGTEAPILKLDWYDSFGSSKVLYCEVSEDNGESWSLIGEIKDSVKDNSNSSYNSYMSEKRFSLEPFAGKTIRIKFTDGTVAPCERCSMPTVWIDNILVSKGEDTKISINDENIEFNSVKIYKTSQKPVVITNSGNNFLTGNISLAEGGEEVYRITPSYKSTGDGIDYHMDSSVKEAAAFRLAPGESQKFYVVFYPQAAQTYNSQIIITSNDSSNPKKIVYLSGEGDDNFLSNHNQMYLRGTFNNWLTDTEMELVDDYTWQVKNIVFEDKTDMRLKFDASGDWTENYGEDSDNPGSIIPSGDDIILTEDNTYAYDIKFYTNGQKRYEITRVEKLPQTTYSNIQGIWTTYGDDKVTGMIYISYSNVEHGYEYQVEVNVADQGYEIYTVTDATFVKLPEVDYDYNEKISIRVKPLVHNLIYMSNNENVRYIDGDYWNEKIIYTGLNRVKNFSAGNIGQNSIDLSWNSVEGATEYAVYQYTYDYGYPAFREVATTESLSCTIDGLLPSTNYRFKIKARNERCESYAMSDELSLETAEGILGSALLLFDNQEVINSRVLINKDGSLYSNLNIYSDYQTGEPSVKMVNLGEGIYTYVLDVEKDRFKYSAEGSFEIKEGNSDLTINVPVIKTPIGNFNSSYETVNLRGTMNNWGNSPMELVDNNIWQLTGVSFKNGDANGEPRFKFDIKGDWTINFGDSNNDNVAELGGSDIIVSGNKEYTVKFNDLTKSYEIIETSGGGGDEDYLKEYNQVYFRGTSNNWVASEMSLVSDHTWEIEQTFENSSEERFKFDINGDWTINFGDNDNDGIAEQSGGDIQVTAGKTYLIKFNDSTKSYSLTEK